MTATPPAPPNPFEQLGLPPTWAPTRLGFSFAKLTPVVLVFAAIGVAVVAWVAVHLPGWWRALAAEDREVEAAAIMLSVEIDPWAEESPQQPQPPKPPDLTLFASGRAR